MEDEFFQQVKEGKVKLIIACCIMLYCSNVERNICTLSEREDVRRGRAVRCARAQEEEGLAASRRAERNGGGGKVQE